MSGDPVTAALVTVFAFLAVATGGASTLEYVLRTRGPAFLQQRLAEELGTSTTIVIDVDSGPLPHVRAVLWDRRLPSLALAAHGVPFGDRGVRLTRLEARIDGLPLEGPRLRPRPGSAFGTFTANLDDEGLPGLLGLPPVVQGLAVHGDGLRVTTVAGVALTCDVELVDGSVQVRPRQHAVLSRLPWPTVAATLPALPFDAIVERLVLQDGHVVAEGTFDTGALAS